MLEIDRHRIVDILTKSFKENKSTNYIIKQDSKKLKRLRKLIEYSIDYGNRFGEVHLSEDNNSCYIILHSDKKKTTLKSIIWDLRLIFQCVGITNIKKVLEREALIKSNHPKEGFVHLWYIGVIPTEQGKGHGTRLLKTLIEKARSHNKKIYLETSTERNFSFYENLGFHEVETLTQLGYSLKMYKIG